MKKLRWVNQYPVESGSNLYDMDFRGADLSNPDMCLSNCRGTNFEDANLNVSSLYCSILSYAN